MIFHLRNEQKKNEYYNDDREKYNKILKKKLSVDRSVEQQTSIF